MDKVDSKETEMEKNKLKATMTNGVLQVEYGGKIVVLERWRYNEMIDGLNKKKMEVLELRGKAKKTEDMYESLLGKYRELEKSHKRNLEKLAKYDKEPPKRTPNVQLSIFVYGCMHKGLSISDTHRTLSARVRKPVSYETVRQYYNAIKDGRLYVYPGEGRVEGSLS